MTIARKRALVDELIARTRAAAETARAAHAAAVEGTTHADARAENDKDTRGLEQSYLARGQAARVEELEAELAELETMAVRAFTARDAVAVGALVAVEEDDERRELLVAPCGGGTLLAGGVQVVTPRSPLGRALLGRRVDDDVEVHLPGKLRELVVIAIA